MTRTARTGNALPKAGRAISATWQSVVIVVDSCAITSFIDFPRKSSARPRQLTLCDLLF